MCTCQVGPPRCRWLTAMCSGARALMVRLGLVRARTAGDGWRPCRSCVRSRRPSWRGLEPAGAGWRCRGSTGTCGSSVSTTHLILLARDGLLSRLLFACLAAPAWTVTGLPGAAGGVPRPTPAHHIDRSPGMHCACAPVPVLGAAVLFERVR